MKAANNDEMSEQITIIKKFGFYGFCFFLCKGLLWLIVPVLITYFGIGLDR